VRDRGGRKVVFILESGRVRMQPVESVSERETAYEILKGLQGGEDVVTGGAIVEDGIEVRIKGRK
jgi:hypothetical protein